MDGEDKMCCSILIYAYALGVCVFPEMCEKMYCDLVKFSWFTIYVMKCQRNYKFGFAKDIKSDS